MLSKEDNEILTQTDRGTPMGELFRRYWLPVLLSEEIPLPDCPPVRFRILGEDLLAFRDSEGVVGVVDSHCPHRGAPLFFGRNEESGIRCLYHGWKFDASGACTDMPNIKNGNVMKAHMRIIAYPVVESAGMIWAYMGPADRQPPLPAFAFFGLPPENYFVTKYELNCNWFQAQEGDYDSTHGQFAHSAWDAVDTVHAMIDQIPETLPSFDTPIGQMIVYSRSIGGGMMQLSAQHIIFPSTLPPGTGTGNGVLAANIRVPIDDEHEMHFRLRYASRPLTKRELLEFRFNGFAYAEHEEGTWRMKANKDNDYLQDRILQRQFNFTGMSAFQLQDASMLEDQWGAICDRTKEHLVAPDIAIVLQRNRLLTMAKNLAEGREPEEPFLLSRRPIVQLLSEPLAPVPEAPALDDATIEIIARGMDTVKVPDYAEAFDSNSLSEYSNYTWDQITEA